MNSKWRLSHVLIVACVLAAHTAPATASCDARSTAATVALLELYTSEGCNSCPPADRWIAELPKKGFDTDRVVPLAFHVDYWNYLGWIDPFAQSVFTQRQRDFARRTGAATIYTPEFILSGREYRRWRWGGFAGAIDRINRKPARADIHVKLQRSGQALQINADASLASGAAPAELYVAVYQSGLSNQVAAGENRGKRLNHDFVVRRLDGPIAFDREGKARFDERIDLPTEWKTSRLGVAAFVQEAAGTEVLQALALDVCA